MRLSILVVAALLAVALAACAGHADQAVEPSVQTPRLTIYSGRNERLVEPIIARFAEETGVQVQVRYGGTAELAATIMEEGANSPADVFWAQDPGGLGALEHRFAPLSESLLAEVDRRFRSPQGRWVGLSGRARVIAYSTERVRVEELPNDLWELTDPQWRGRVGWAPTNASFQAMVTAMRTLWGEAETARWLREMQANDPVIYPNNTSQLVGLAAGEIDLALVNHYYLYSMLREQGEEFPVRNHHLAGGPGSIVLVAGIGILEGAPNAEAAERLVAYLISPASQQYFAEQTFEYPVIGGIDTHPLLTPLDAIRAPELQMSALADLAGTLALLRETGILP